MEPSCMKGGEGGQEGEGSGTRGVEGVVGRVEHLCMAVAYSAVVLLELNVQWD